MRKYIFGPSSTTFSPEDLGSSSAALLFDFEAKHSLNLAGVSSWQEVLRKLPGDWRPNHIVLSLSYTTIPAGLWQAPVPIIGLAHDWNLLWSTYRHILPRCDMVLTDQPGVERFQRAGFSHVRAAQLFGLEASFLAGLPTASPSRDIDVLFVGNCNPNVQRERLAWLGQIGKLASKWNVVIRERVFGDEYRQLLCRSKIVFNRSIRGECNKRVFEAMAGGALLLQKRDNSDVASILRPGVDYVPYSADDLEMLIDHYLTHDDERQAIVENAKSRLHEFTYAACWERVLAELEPEWERLRQRAAMRAEAGFSPDAACGAWSAASGGSLDEIQSALKEGPMTAAKANAAGLFVAKPSEAVECFGQALQMEPGNAVAGLNRAEALARCGRNGEAIGQAQRALQVVVMMSPETLDTPHYPPGFDLFGVEWEAAGWRHAGDPDAEREAKRTLLRCWLHLLLADLTGNLSHYISAEQARPDLWLVQAALGCALARTHRLAEAGLHLRAAIAANPFDRVAARALYQVLTDLGEWAERATFVQSQIELHRAAPELAPQEAWFLTTHLSGLERSSIIILACNQADLTQLCLESVLRHTRGDYELILVDNGSTDETAALFEEFRSRPGPARVQMIRNDENRGFAAGVNQGLAEAQGEFLVLLNNDTVVTPHWLEGLIAGSLRDWPHVGLVGPMTNYTAAPQLIEPGYSDLFGLDAFADERREEFSGQSLDVGRLTGFCLLIRRAVLEKVGGRLDERYGLGFFEDDDLSHAARAAGFKLTAARDVYIHHFGSRTFASLGIDTEKQLQGNFERFRAKWGEEAARHYRMPRKELELRTRVCLRLWVESL